MKFFFRIPSVSLAAETLPAFARHDTDSEYAKCDSTFINKQ